MIHQRRPRNLAAFRRASRCGFHRSLPDLVTRAIALAMLLATSCLHADGVIDETEVTTQAREGSESLTNVDAAQSSSTVDDTSATGSATGDQQGGIILFDVKAKGPDSEAVTTATQTTCFETPSTGPVSVSVLSPSMQIEKDCSVDEKAVEVAFRLYAQWANNPIAELFAGQASIGCNDDEVTVVNLDPFTPTIPGHRYSGGTQRQLQDAFAVDAGDLVRFTLALTARAAVPAGDGEFASTSVKGSVRYSRSFPALQPVACASCECETTDECIEDAICVDCMCREPVVASEPLDLEITGGSVEPGETFSLAVAASLHTGDFRPETIELSVDTDALDLNGPFVEGSSIGVCANRLVIVDSDNVLFVDRNSNGTLDSTDPLISIEEADGRLRIEADLRVPDGEFLVPVDFREQCTLFQTFVAGVAGTHAVDVTITGAFPEGEDGAHRPVRTLQEFLTIGDGEIDCANPVRPATSLAARAARAVTTTADALFILRAAVGTRECALCICDVDGNGGINTNDALRALRLAVGLSVTLACPACT